MTEEQVRVLVVDDEEGVRNLLQRVLAEAGYNVVTAANGEQALDKVSQLNTVFCRNTYSMRERF